MQSWLIFGRTLIEFPSKYDRIVIECWSIELWSNCDHIIIEFCSMFDRTLHQTLVNVWSKFDPILLQLWSNFDQILIENRSRDPPGAPWTSKGCEGTIWSVPGALWECPGSGPGAPNEHQARYFWGLENWTNSGTQVLMAFWTSWTQKWLKFVSIDKQFWTNF